MDLVRIFFAVELRKIKSKTVSKSSHVVISRDAATSIFSKCSEKTNRFHYNVLFKATPNQLIP